MDIRNENQCRTSEIGMKMQMGTMTKLSRSPRYSDCRTNIYALEGYEVSEGASALAEWMEAGIQEEYEVFYINFMFDQLPGSRDAVLQQMRKRIHDGFYSKLCRFSAHHPKSPGERHRLAEAMLFPDLPTYKQTGGSLLYGNANGGVHYNGAIRIPLSSRLRGSLQDYVEKNALDWRREGFRVNVQTVSRSPERLADYATKTVKRGLASPDDIFLLPLSGAEIRRERLKLTPYEKAIKDIESSTNCSRESAEETYRSSDPQRSDFIIP
jgi:hypothetical protein